MRLSESFASELTSIFADRFSTVQAVLMPLMKCLAIPILEV